MISKEEIEKAIERIDKRLTIEKYTKNIATPIYISDLKVLLNYIEQLETREQKIIKSIEKLYISILKEHNIAINNFMRKEIPFCLGEGKVAQEAGYILGKLEEILKEISMLKIIEIPDDVEWIIEQHDGNEWVSEKHKIWS